MKIRTIMIRIEGTEEIDLVVGTRTVVDVLKQSVYEGNWTADGKAGVEPGIKYRIDVKNFFGRRELA